SSTSLVVSTTIDPPSPSINTELASEKPTATHTPLVTLMTSRRNSAECARNFSRPANSWAAAPQMTMSTKSPASAALASLQLNNRRMRASERLPRGQRRLRDYLEGCPCYGEETVIAKTATRVEPGNGRWLLKGTLPASRCEACCFMGYHVLRCS